MSTTPLSPKPSEGLPVAASKDRSFRPAGTRMRSGVLRSPGKKPRPRLVIVAPCGPPGTSRCQITLPVSASSATTLLPAGRYMTPPTTIGTASDAAPSPPPPPRPPRPSGTGNLYDQACVSLSTLPALISVSGEKRVPARSLLYVCHSCAGVAGFLCALTVTAITTTASADVSCFMIDPFGDPAIS